jgi:hypothetical protein
MTARRGDLEHGTNAAYVAGCVCEECREHQRLRMARGKVREGTRSRTEAPTGAHRTPTRARAPAHRLSGLSGERSLSTR